MIAKRPFSPRGRFLAALLAVATLAVLIVSTSAQSGDLGTITLIDQTNLGTNGAITDVWGWIHPVSGVEYAIVGDNASILQGFWVVDISDPANVVKRKHVTGVYGFDVKTYDRFVYSTPSYGGVTVGGVVDLLDIDNPVYHTNAFVSAHNILLDPRGWLFLSDTSGDELMIYDVRTTPTSPTFAWRDSARGGHDISIKGNWLYDFHGFSFTRIYDIADPATPILRGEVVDSDIVYHHSGYPSEDGKYLFICDELGTNPTPDVTVWNIEDLSNPFKVAEIRDDTGSVHNLYIVGDYAYVSFYRKGFRVYDVTDPTNPQLADEYDTHGGTELEGAFDGAFGVYPFTQSGVILVSDEQSGLFVFDFQPGTTSAVAIKSFVAAYLGGYVRLDWSIGSADDLRGFHIYRSRERDRGFVRMNAAMIPADVDHRFDDYDVDPGVTYHYRMGAIDRDGEVLSQIRTLTVPIRSVRMEQNYPNPFNPATTIQYQVGETVSVRITVFDSRGQKIRTLVDGVTTPGIHQAVWDGHDGAGTRVASGIYFYRMVAGGETITRRLALIK